LEQTKSKLEELSKVMFSIGVPGFWVPGNGTLGRVPKIKEP
jgi:hypothetical protein